MDIEIDRLGVTFYVYCFSFLEFISLRICYSYSYSPTLQGYHAIHDKWLSRTNQGFHLHIWVLFFNRATIIFVVRLGVKKHFPPLLKKSCVFLVMIPNEEEHNLLVTEGQVTSPRLPVNNDIFNSWSHIYILMANGLFTRQQVQGQVVNC
jgi:hypothetical protein